MKNLFSIPLSLVRKSLILLLGGILMTSTNIAQAIEVKVNVTGINIKRGGNIIVMIFGEKGFPKVHKQALAAQTIRATKNTLEFNFVVKNLKNNELAVKVLHDENGDGKVTKNWTGIIPKEGLGFSNGQKIGITGPPSYKKSKLSKEQFRTGISIPVKYP